MLRKRRWLILCAALLITTGCFPTTEDMDNALAAGREFTGGLHAASDDLMTQQHSAMNPELHDPFVSMLDEAVAKGAALAATAGETKASGPAVAGLLGESNGLVPWILGLFNLGWIYPFIKGFGKSRASTEIAKATADITALKLELATAAKSGGAVPSDA